MSTTADTSGNVLSQQDTQRSTESSEHKRTRVMRADTTTAMLHSQNPDSIPSPPLPEAQTSLDQTQLDRVHSTAIGEHIDTQPVEDTPAVDAGPTLMITLLLLTGARHPFNLDARYLQKRSVNVQNNDPFNLSIYKVKELILREWRDEWETKPSSPSAIRLISFGKVLDDKSAIKDLKFNATSANVVHMSIKPQDFVEDEEAKGSKAARTQSHEAGERRSPGCRCTVM